MSLLLYSYTLDFIRCGDNVSNESFWKSLQQMSQQPVKEKTWQRVEDSFFQHSLGGQSWAQDRSYQEGSFNSIKEPFLTELLNNECTACEVESLQVFKVERQPWRRDACIC